MVKLQDSYSCAVRLTGSNPVPAKQFWRLILTVYKYQTSEAKTLLQCKIDWLHCILYWMAKQSCLE